MFIKTLKKRCKNKQEIRANAHEMRDSISLILCAQVVLVYLQ